MPVATDRPALRREPLPKGGEGMGHHHHKKHRKCLLRLLRKEPLLQIFLIVLLFGFIGGSIDG